MKRFREPSTPKIFKRHFLKNWNTGSKFDLHVARYVFGGSRNLVFYIHHGAKTTDLGAAWLHDYKGDGKRNGDFAVTSVFHFFSCWSEDVIYETSTRLLTTLRPFRNKAKVYLLRAFYKKTGLYLSEIVDKVFGYIKIETMVNYYIEDGCPNEPGGKAIHSFDNKSIWKHFNTHLLIYTVEKKRKKKKINETSFI